MSMSDPGYDETDMTPEEFDARMARAREARLAREAPVGNQSSGTRTTMLNVPAFVPLITPNLKRPLSVSQA